MPEIESALAIVLAMGRDGSLSPLTTHRSKAAIPFGGNYRVVDFTLTNCLRSGIRNILLMAQYKSHSLQKHLRDGWSILNAEVGEYITLVPPQMRTHGSCCYNGATDALKQNAFLIERSQHDYVVVMAGEHLYRMDYAALLEAHVQSGADVTLACNDVNDPCRYGSRVSLDDQRQIKAVTPLITTADDVNQVQDPMANAIAMDIVVFSKAVLLDLLASSHHESSASITQDLLAGRLDHYDVRAYPFGGEKGRVTPDRYWCTLDSLDDYYQANMELLKPTPAIDLYQTDWPIRTYQAQNPPARTVPGKSCNEGLFVNSIVSAGTMIAGGGVNHSILFPQVRVEDAATVQDSILLSGVEVGEGARLLNCIVDKDVSIPPNETIGEDPELDASRFTVTDKGVVVVPKGYLFQGITRAA